MLSSGLCVGLITRPEESYRVCCVSECDRQDLIMRRHWGGELSRDVKQEMER